LGAVTEPCETCRANRGEVATPGGPIFDDGRWRIEHAFEPIPMVGWLVLKPHRHVESLGDLEPDEAAALGPLIAGAGAAMREVLGCRRIYVVCFAEAVAHVHLHLIPRQDDLPRDRRGPGVFEYLSEAKRGGRNLGDPGEAARVAGRVRERMAGAT
jgi:diadenosine tetraphosphate (Ap4A) HIT family hydrolase